MWQFIVMTVHTRHGFIALSSCCQYSDTNTTLNYITVTVPNQSLPCPERQQDSHNYQFCMASLWRIYTLGIRSHYLPHGKWEGSRLRHSTWSNIYSIAIAFCLQWNRLTLHGPIKISYFRNQNIWLDLILHNQLRYGCTLKVAWSDDIKIFQN